MKKAVLLGTMRSVLLLLFSGMFITHVQAQEKSDQFKDHFFVGIISSYYLDYATSPVSIVDLSDNSDDPWAPYQAVPFQTTFFSLVSLGVEPRYNFHELNQNHAFAVSIPATIGFGEALPANDNVAGMSGYLSLQLPMMLKYYGGTNATYKSKGDFGFSFGAGYEYNRLALLPVDDPQGIYNSSKLLDANKGWLMPVFSASFLFWRNNAPIEINVKYGEGKIKTYKVNRYGQPLNRSIQTRASSIKLSFVYLLDQ